MTRRGRLVRVNGIDLISAVQCPGFDSGDRWGTTPHEAFSRMFYKFIFRDVRSSYSASQPIRSKHLVR
jgi:hypothetical protein